MNSPTVSGAASPARWSSASNPGRALGLELALLLAAGMAAAVLNASDRLPLQLPGHHGMEWLAILMSARLLSARPGAAMATACGAALAALAVGAHALQPATYLVQGVVLDGAFALLGRRAALWPVTIALGGLVHALAPLMKEELSTQGLGHFGSLSRGLAFPLSAHLLFGAIGAACAAAGVAIWHRSRGRRGQ